MAFLYLILAYPLGLEPRLTVLETAMLPLHYGYKLEQRVRFELTTLRICNPLHLTTLPPLHNWSE